MKQPVYCFSKESILGTLEGRLDEMGDLWWGKPFYYGAGLVIDFKGGYVEKLIKDSNFNPGNAERIYLNDVMSGRITPYNPIESMSGLSNDSVIAGYIADWFASLLSQGKEDEIRKSIKESVSVMLREQRSRAAYSDLIQLGQALETFFMQQGDELASKNVHDAFSYLSVLPYSKIMGSGKPFLTVSEIIKNKLIYVLDVSPKNISATVVPTADKARCIYIKETVAFLAGLLVLDFWQHIGNLPGKGRLTYPPLTVLINGFDLVIDLPWGEIVADLVSANCIGYLTLAGEQSKDYLDRVGPKARIIYSGFPELIEHSRSFTPFTPLESYSFSLSDLTK